MLTTEQTAGSVRPKRQGGVGVAPSRVPSLSALLVLVRASSLAALVFFRRVQNQNRTPV